MAEAIEAITAEAPLMMVLEDLHWSDYSTLDLLAFLARRRDRAQLLVVGTYRPVDVILAAYSKLVDQMRASDPTMRVLVAQIIPMAASACAECPQRVTALNAAIQASMAGDAGRGFAVVADEVQRLAERSSAATRQIETLVRAIQADTNEAVISMEQTTTEVVRGARLAQDAGVALEEIEGVSKTLAALIQSISNAAQQQTSSAGQISLTMNVIQQITSQTSSGSTATAESIGNLAKMASQLRRSVSGFTLPATQAQVADKA